LASRGSDTTFSPQDDDIHPKSLDFDILAPARFPGEYALPPRTKFTAGDFCSGIIRKIAEGMPFDQAKSL
jgi:hypothetical protein